MQEIWYSAPMKRPSEPQGVMVHRLRSPELKKIPKQKQEDKEESVPQGFHWGHFHCPKDLVLGPSSYTKSLSMFISLSWGNMSLIQRSLGEQTTPKPQHSTGLLSARVASSLFFTYPLRYPSLSEDFCNLQRPDSVFYVTPGTMR